MKIQRDNILPYKYKKNLALYIFLIISIMVTKSAMAADDRSVLPLLNEIQAQSAKVQSFSCKFTQERHLALFVKPVIFQGLLSLIRPDHLRWEFTEPIPSVLLFSGDKGVRCNDNAPPVHFDLTSDPVMRLVAEQLWTWLDSNYEKLEQLYSVTQSGASILVITPKDQSMADFIETITISFSAESKQPERVEITEPGGDLTRIHFHDYNLNVSLPEKLFVECGTRE
jgi:outer membrane lipoprotein-sorting protein